MSKQAIINDIRKNYGNMLNISQLAKVFNCNRKTVPKYVEGLPFLRTGKEKKYYVVDVAGRIYDRMEVTS
jgi:predicted AAA+ superfamily ATPase